MIVTVLFAPLFHGRVYDLFNDATVVSQNIEGASVGGVAGSSKLVSEFFTNVTLHRSIETHPAHIGIVVIVVF